ncbi:MAG: hypothetical protein GY780_10060 [bacterium]|nr:hypothetical protein [bacterium]
MKKRIFLLLIFLVIGVGALPTIAGLRQISGLFGEARYEEARKMFNSDDSSSRPGEEALWEQRLATDPNQAVEILQAQINDGAIPVSTRQGMALQLAQIHFASQDYEKAHQVLSELINSAPTPLPGEVFLLAGLTERTAGNKQAAREYFASVKPGDPAFSSARYFLGDIGLSAGEPELAQRYFESGAKNSNEEEWSRLKSGQWRALRAQGKDSQAESLHQEIKSQSQGCLALVEIERFLQLEKDESEIRIATALEAEPDSLATTPGETSGRYSLQVGAFSDRSLALEFKNSHSIDIPNLEISEFRDDRGQFIYKVRFGNFVNPARARSEAKRQEQKLGIDIFVVDLSLQQ